jgi:hypothetical protein
MQRQGFFEPLKIFSVLKIKWAKILIFSSRQVLLEKKYGVDGRVYFLQSTPK